MALRYDISCNRLTEGDSIVFGTLGIVGTYGIDVIGATTIPRSGEVQETNNYVPSFDIAKLSVERLALEISNIPRVTSVQTNGTVISIFFESGVTDITFLGTLNCIRVKIILDDGSNSDFADPLVANITVTDVKHNLTNFLTPLLPNPHGVMGDLTTTKISFSVANAFNFIEFYYGWVDNDTILYPNPTINQIELSNFEDITTGALQKFIGDGTAINPVAPLQGNKVISMALTNVGGLDYELLFTHVIPILPRPTDTVGNTLVQPSEITTSLKMPFQILLRDSLFNTNPLETTAKQDLTPFIQNGGIGYFNEIQNSGLKYYDLISLTWNNPENRLNSGFDTSGTIIINNSNSNFNINYDVLLKIVELTDSFNESLTLLENEKFETIQIKMDGAITSNTVFKNVSATFVGNITTINFEIAAATYQNDYALWVELGSGSTSFDQQNTLVTVDSAINAADDTTVVFGTFPSANRDEYNYNNHYNLDIANAFNQVKSYVDDFQLSRFRVVNNDLINNTLISFTIRIRSGNNVLDSFQINNDDLNYSFPRNYNLEASDPHNFVTVNDDGSGNYDFNYPFQIGENWVNLDNVFQETIATFEQQTASGLIQFKNTWISPLFQFGKYNQSNNTFGEPQITVPPANIKYYNQSGTLEVGKILNKGITKIVATFTETNLNDLQADPAAPFTYSDNVFIDNYLCAYFGILAKGQYFRFHNLQNNGSTPFSGNFPILERVSINEATLTAFVDAADIRSFLGTDFDCLQITARIDKLQFGAIVAKAYKNDSYTSGYS